MTDFHPYPRIAHLAWLGEKVPREDKILSSEEAMNLLSVEVVAEEKLDGANLGFTLEENGEIRVQNRGDVLRPPYSGQFRRLTSWIESRRDSLRTVLEGNRAVFGEWCAARHSIRYTALPDWLIVFDVFDIAVGRFLSVDRRDSAASSVGLSVAATVCSGRLTMHDLILALERKSSYGDERIEGLVVRRDLGGWLDRRAKLVRPDFLQSIGPHWRSRALDWNRISR